jgi:F-type H+-transporting ATPase subunit alpha
LGTDLDAATKRQLDRGAAMVELLKQPQYVPMDVIDQVLQIFAGSKGFLDDLAKKDVPTFAAKLLEHFKAAGSSLREELQSKQAISSDLSDKLMESIKQFKANWKSA